MYQVVQTQKPACRNDRQHKEQDQLDEAPGVKPTSRLACQAVPSGEADIVVEVPDWNRNLVQEGH